MDHRPLPTDSPDAAWQGGANAAAVELPADVAERARRVQENLERARRAPTELQITLLACSFFGPLLFR
jgi:hypothetical protein